MTLQTMFENELEKSILSALNELIERKLQSAGVDPQPRLVDQIVERIQEGNFDKFLWDDDSNIKPDKDITLDISENDISDVEKRTNTIINSIPKIIDSLSTTLSKSITKDLKKKWKEEHALQLNEHRIFNENLEKRWGKALGLLRMQLTISLELGREVAKFASDEECDLSNIMLRLHCRACQVSAEIISLLSNGYADGAMARWRTLHEIAIVMILMREHGEPLAERYRAHTAVEAKLGKDQYFLCYKNLGFEPLDATTCDQIEADYELAIKKYGREFRGSYGWAFGYIDDRNGRIGLGELEAAAGKSNMASHYKLASYNVHAGPHALFFRLGLIDDSGFLAGASNAGLSEPGQNTAIDLALTSVLLVGDDVSLDVLVSMKILQILRDEIPTAFAKAEKKLKADHIRYSKEGIG